MCGGKQEPELQKIYNLEKSKSGYYREASINISQNLIERKC